MAGMNSNNTQFSLANPSSKMGLFRKVRLLFLGAAAGLTFVAATATQAQVSTINSAQIKPRVFDDIPAATLTIITNYPTEISFTESNVSSSTGFANRDVWYFSADGGT